MNEEIFKRLQDQCWIYPTHPDMIDTDSSGEVRPCGFDTKKFALLIVRECGGFVYNYPQKYLTRNQAREISLAMEEHFGVK